MSAAALALLLTACESAGVDGGPPAASSASPPATIGAEGATDCRGLGLDECAGRPGCEQLWGWQPAAYCAATATAASRLAVGCHAAGEACPEEETCAAPAGESGLLVFPNRCLPDGWTRRPLTDCCPGS